MTLGHQPDEVPEENLYAAPAVTDQAAATTDSAKPMTAASGISVILAVLVSGPVFVATFWVTCLGLEIDNRFVSLMALATSVVAVILVYKCILAIGRIFDNT